MGFFQPSAAMTAFAKRRYAMDHGCEKHYRHKAIS
jgi:hypothetical protein